MSTVLYSVLLHKINTVTKSTLIAISHKHKRKILNLQHTQQKSYNSDISYSPKQVVHHIPSKVTRNSVNTEFESFYQSLLLDISTIPEESIARRKTQLRSTCKKYYSVFDAIPFRYRQAIKRLSNNKDIVILKQDKGRGVIMLNHSKYIEKCLSIVNSNQFLQVDKDPTASIERKAQKTLRKIKDKIPSLLYSKTYPTG